MKLRKWFENVDLTKVKWNLGFLETEWEPKEPDREAGWELYVEMLTRMSSRRFRPRMGTSRRR